MLCTCDNILARTDRSKSKENVVLSVTGITVSVVLLMIKSFIVCFFAYTKCVWDSRRIRILYPATPSEKAEIEDKT
jgi:hypothetical protein